MDPIHLFSLHQLNSRNLDQWELQRQLELRFARRSIRRKRRSTAGD